MGIQGKDIWDLMFPHNFLKEKHSQFYWFLALWLTYSLSRSLLNTYYIQSAAGTREE